MGQIGARILGICIDPFFQPHAGSKCVLMIEIVFLHHILSDMSNLSLLFEHLFERLELLLCANHYQDIVFLEL
jgi:hypothetical protein